jgi:hypothetical protein
MCTTLRYVLGVPVLGSGAGSQTLGVRVASCDGLFCADHLHSHVPDWNTDHFAVMGL